MFTKLDNKVVGLLACPICKGALLKEEKKFICNDCGTEFPFCKISQNNQSENIPDFRIKPPHYCLPENTKSWVLLQQDYEKSYFSNSNRDNKQLYLNEINSVQEIYLKEFKLKGKILDVGGGVGKLRHFLNENIDLYISIDPFPEVFQNMHLYPNMLKAYPVLTTSCNFLACKSEFLPFAKNSFDWVHMRSVLDHFQDPYFAIKEAYRVLKPGGTLLIGLSIIGGKSSASQNTAPGVKENMFSIIVKIKNAFKKGGPLRVIKKGLNHIIPKKSEPDHHSFEWHYDNLIDLLKSSKFEIVKECWQKPPYTMCIYLAAIKKQNI